MPKRYAYTGRGLAALQAWMDSSYKYSILQIYLGYNPTSRLEVVSMLNILSQSRNLYIHDSASAPKKNPKIYLGSALQSISTGWIKDEKNPSTTSPNFDEDRTQKQVILKILMLVQSQKTYLRHLQVILRKAHVSIL